MTDKPRRYVTVQRVQRGTGGGRTLPWWRYDCHCGVMGGKYDLTEALTRAHRHAASCVTVRTLTERDRLAAELATERADNSRLRADRAAWRTQAIQLAADLIEAREERA